MFFFINKLKGAIISQNHCRRQGGGSGSPGPLNRNATNDKNFTKKPCFFIFRFFCSIFVHNSTRVQSRSQDFGKRGGGGLFLKFASTVNELDPNFYLARIGLRQNQSVFLSKNKRSSKKKKKVFAEIQSLFLSKIR